MAAQTSTPAPPSAAQPAPPPKPLAFRAAVDKAAGDLLAKLPVPAEPGRKVLLTLDPLIDGLTGHQTASTLFMNARITEIAARDFKHIEVLPFTAATLARKPVVLIGTLSAIDNRTNRSDGPRDAYRVWLTAADLSRNVVAAKAQARAEPAGIDLTPLPFFQDSPVWSLDPATKAYIETCHAGRLDEPINPRYVERLAAAALTTDATAAYNAGQYATALDLYRAARKEDGGDQLRVLNGIYLAAAKLSRADEAKAAFSDLVDHSLKANQLAVKFLFRPGSTQFAADPSLTANYGMWLAEIARKSRERDTCLELVGHASPTGGEPLNLWLSGVRAQHIRNRLLAQDRTLAKRLVTRGVGSKEAVVANGRDDATDALDRRVEFKPAACGPVPG